MRKRYAVIPTHDRPDDFRECFRAIASQVDGGVVVSHQADYVEDVIRSTGFPWWFVQPYTYELPNISVMWNMGLRQLADTVKLPYDVAVLNDDAVVPSHWFSQVASTMRQAGAAAGSHDYHGRMAGHAFILSGEAQLFADEQFVWWYGDDDLERRARDQGGVCLLPNLTVEHRHPNTTTVGRMARIAGRDRERYVRKWA